MDENLETYLKKIHKITTWFIIPSTIIIIGLLFKIVSLLSVLPNIWDKMEWWHP